MEGATTLLFRQIAACHRPDGRISSAAFVPGPSHKGLLSTRHERVGAKRSYLDYAALHNDSLGSWAVTAGEVEDNGTCDGIRSYLDEKIDGAPEGHVSIDFNPSPSKTATKKIARHLARKAEARGCLHPAPELAA